MPNLIPGQVIRLSDSDLDALSKFLQDEITHLETQHTTYFNKIKVWWRWYEAEPRRRRKDWPFVGSSNIIVPLIQIMSDSLVARAFSGIFGPNDKVWMARTENEDNTVMANDMARYINWQARNDFDFRLTMYDMLSEMYPIGSSVIALNWRDEQRYIYAPGVRNGRFSKSVAQRVTLGRGPSTEFSPRECYLWDTSYPIGEAPVVVREFGYQWAELKNKAVFQKGGWIDENVESVKGETGRQGPSREVAQEKKRLDHISDMELELYHEPLDIREVHVDYPVLENGHLTKRGAEDLRTPNLPIVVTLHRKTGKILRVNAEPYNLPWKPFFDFYFKKRSGRGHAVGVAKRLENMQSMMTTQFNQSIDSVTRSNAVWAITSSRKHMDSPIDPSHPIFAPGMEKEFRELKLSPSVMPNMALIQAAQVISERQMGIYDPALGRESRQGGHPSPATSTLALLENADVMAAPVMSMIRHQISRIGESIAILDQQFETDQDGKIERVLGGIDALSAGKFLFPVEPVPGNYQFDVVGLSPQNNPDSEMQRAIQVGQMNQLYWTQVIQAAQMLDNPQVGPRVKMAWLKYIDSTTNTYMRFLESANVDEFERYILNLRRAQQQGAQEMGAVALEPGGAGQAAGPAPQSPLGIPAQFALGGEAGAPGGPS